MKKYLHSNIPQLISKRLINMEIDSPMIKEIFCDLSCLINRLSIVPEKKNCKKKQKNKKKPKEIVYGKYFLRKFERQPQCLALLRYFFNTSLY